MDEHGIIHKRSQGLIDFAFRFAKEAHGDQKRKYTGEPYIVHPVEVAHIVASVTEDCAMIAAALLHDVIEDTSVSKEDIAAAGFGHRIANLVEEVSDISKPEDGNRKVRKEIDRQHLAQACPEAQTVKLADLISNSASITQHDPNFAKVYMAEKLALLEVLGAGNQELWHRATDIVEDYYRLAPNGE